MSLDIDIIAIDAKIQNQFNELTTKLEEYKKKLVQFESYLDSDYNPRSRNIIEKKYQEMKENVITIESKQELNFYIIETIELINSYKNILKTPIKLNFMGKAIQNDGEKQRIVTEYLEIAQKYIDINDINYQQQKKKLICDNCQSKDFDVIDENVYICQHCFSQQTVLQYISSYKDIDRINISSKYMYDRKIHFRDCMNQYQGKQNSTIDQKIYNDLEQQFENHHLLLGDKNTTKETRFKQITKEHILLFLKDLEHTKHYENVNLIHYTLTGKKPDDIGYLEDKLLNDFDMLVELYDKTYKNNIERKNFINTQYVLYQLLMRHKHPCKTEDFTILKTIDRKSFHDEITKNLFVQLGWNHTPFY